MALLFMDGFDHSGTSGSIHGTKYGSGFLNLGTSSPRTGTGVGRANDGFTTMNTKTLPTSGSIAIIGLAIRFDIVASESGSVILLQEGGTVHVRLEFTSARVLRVVRGDGTVLSSLGTTAFVVNTWYYVEWKSEINDTTGSWEVRVDGVTEISGTGDTRNGGTGIWNNIQIKGFGSGSTFLSFDDLYICDGSGAAPHNNFLGTCKVETLLPQTGNGSNVGLTPSTGTDHGALVDENPPNTTDYNSSPTVGLKDTYNYPSMTLTGTIYGIQTNLYVNKSDAAARQVCAVVRTNSTDYDGVNISPTSTFSYNSEIRKVNPNTGVAWTVADIAAIEAGMKVTA